ncbi:hypothetical protein [Acetobacterium sp.]|uniref:hypothetical protein n=1 Tax=Acetobacterium sp. TaxID=1872094 RepID=UPI002F3EFF27
MLKRLAKWFFPGFILVFALLAGGCQSLFIPKNVPIALWEGLSSKNQPSQEITIQSFHTITPGIVQDISNNGNSLIILNSENSKTNFNINTYDTDAQSLSSFISSDKRVLSALYDSFDAGIYYVVETVDANTGKASSQLLWTDINRDTTRVISLPEENVVKCFGIGESDQVIYSNNNNEIIIADNQGSRQIYTTPENYSILSVDYMKITHSLVFMANPPTGAEKTNLYYGEIKADSVKIIPKLVAENVIDFDVNKANNQLVFIKNTGQNQSIATWSVNSTPQTTLAAGNFGTVTYTSNGDKVVYTQYSSNVDSQFQSIWIMDPNGKKPLQITSPLKLNSQIICDPSKSILYFSVDTTKDVITAKDRIFTQTYEFTYTIK